MHAESADDGPAIKTRELGPLLGTFRDDATCECPLPNFNWTVSGPGEGEGATFYLRPRGPVGQMSFAVNRSWGIFKPGTRKSVGAIHAKPGSFINSCLYGGADFEVKFPSEATPEEKAVA